MRHLFTIRSKFGAPSIAFEQDVTVTTSQTRNVKVQPGDVVRVLAEATVEAVVGNGEVELSALRPVKVVAVQRSK